MWTWPLYKNDAQTCDVFPIRKEVNVGQVLCCLSHKQDVPQTLIVAGT